MAFLEVGLWILLSIMSSTSLILVNKQLGFEFKKQFTITITSFHLLATWIGLKIIFLVKRFETAPVPTRKRWELALLVVMSIVTMNYNLKYNSVGFYQMSKLLCIPYIVAYEYIIKRVKRSLPELLSLGIVLIGVAIFSVSDIEVNLTGTIFACMAVTSTAHNQMLTNQLQKDFKLSGPALQLSVIPMEWILCGVSSFTIEWFGEDSFFENEFTVHSIVLTLITCICSIGVNTATFGLIGKTSAVTYQVVGHLKTVILLVLGYAIFPTKWEDKAQIARAVVGIDIALIGVFSYSWVKMRENKKVIDDDENEDTVNLLQNKQVPETNPEEEETQDQKFIQL